RHLTSPRRMKNSNPSFLVCAAITVIATIAVKSLHAQETTQSTPPLTAKSNADLPTLFIVGDSTVKNGANGGKGWGECIGKLFDISKINVQNRAIGGRSSRTFINEGRWDKVLEAAKPGDFLIVQMGHNDGGQIDDSQRARGSLPGTGEETKEIENPIMH